MKILVLGAGVIGITTAYELIKTGHDVTIIDRMSEPAMETSYFNTGHGYLGWTMCAGSAKITSDLINEKKVGIDLEGMTLDTL